MREKQTPTRPVADRAHRAPRVGSGPTSADRDKATSSAVVGRMTDGVPGKLGPQAVLALQRTVGNRAVGQVVGARRAQPTPPNVTSMIIQPLRARVLGTMLWVDVTRVVGGKYVDNTTGQHYVMHKTKTEYGGHIVVPVVPVKKKGPYGKLSKHYKKWRSSQTTAKRIKTPYGPVKARHNRGAPFISSKAAEYKKAKLGDTYQEFIRGLRGTGTATDAEIAKDLLSGKNDAIKEELQKRAAAMIMATVHLAEQWRKQGAVKIFNAILREIAAGKYDLDSIPTKFAFVASADAGRRQTARFQDRHEKKGKLDKKEEKTFGELSDVEDDDFSSDDDMRDEKELKTKRLYAKKHRK